jgi:hypothetical protein
MSIVKPTLNIDVLKMEQTFFIAYQKGQRAFYVDAPPSSFIDSTMSPR